MFALLSATALIAAGVQAQKPAKPAAKADELPRAGLIVDELVACRAIPADAERLACFDRTAAAFATARADKQLRVVDREDVKRTKRSLFGFSIPDFNLFGGGKKDDDDGVPEIKEVVSTIKSVRALRMDLYTVTLADDSVWTFADPVIVPPKVGDPIKITKGLLTSFKASVKGRIAVRIQRNR